MEKELRIIISGGGTGGHIFPAVSIANAIKEQCPDAKILFVGAEGRMESNAYLMPVMRLSGYRVARIDRKRLWKNFAVLINWRVANGKQRVSLRSFALR